MSVLILLIALLLALAAGYFFLQWKCPSIKDKITTICEESQEEGENFNEQITKMTEASPPEIKEAKKKLSEEIKEGKEKMKNKELGEEEKTESKKDLQLMREIQTLLQKVEKKEDLEKKVYGTWDYVYAGGIFCAVLVASYYILGKVKSLLKGEVDK